MSFLEELFAFNGKVAVVIGGSGVLGGAMAQGLAKAGANIAILGRTPEKVEKRTQEISAIGVKALGIVLMAEKRVDLQKAKQQIIDHFGSIDILINAPGINSATPFFDISEEEWEKIIQVNLKSVFLACQIFGKWMVEQESGGSIINISSVSSGPPLSKIFTYSISKAGINNLTQNLAREWAPYQVRVNAIIPGFFPAEQNRKILTRGRVKDIMGHTPMKRFGEPFELVGATLWLASSKASSFVTGAIVPVDGGFTCMTI